MISRRKWIGAALVCLAAAVLAAGPAKAAAAQGPKLEVTYYFLPG
jgi:hypothetical protein